MDDRKIFVNNLSEALPYLQAFRGKTLVIKYGGAAMVQEEARDAFIQDIVLLRTVGIKPVVVHGGGPMITEMLKKVGKTTEFIEGLRVTDRETVDITEMVLAGVLNKGIVASINRAGGLAVGISGKDGNLVEAVKHQPSRPGKDDSEIIEKLDIGYVGEVKKINPGVLTSLDEAGFVPVVAPLGVGSEGETYNINADTVAGALAGALKAEKLILMTDTPGILRDPKDSASLISQIDFDEVTELTQRGVIAGGMIPKTLACLDALENGCRTCHIIDGRIPHSALLEIFSKEGIGTLIKGR
ncbi:MAG: acetylglutamate kinase [Candidatus Omnitrophica bacterium]|nr:acetylglutamate kinase [Candidatus Omnitrophota bacterium]MCA9424380.1 acetylglutamate kinase [Candidatus Omnitrophota bacterium]MCA9441012.1 acetylglutamate kinase [Candidatus Omnitrophota bacterium]